MSESGASAYTSVWSDCNSRLHVPLEAWVSNQPQTFASSFVFKKRYIRYHSRARLHVLTSPSSGALIKTFIIVEHSLSCVFDGDFEASKRTQRQQNTTSLQSCDSDMGSCSVQRLFKEKLQWLKPHVPQQPDQPSSDTPSPPDPVNYSSTLANERVEDQALIKAIKWIKHFPL